MAEKWNLSGTYFEACNCDAACPCVFLSAPTTGECTVLVAWHVDQGSFEDVNLSGLNVVMAAHSLGHMLQTPWKVALYIDANANENQQEALTKIFGGQAGGVPAALGEHIGEVLGVTNAAINYRKNGKTRSLEIAGIAQATVEGLAGQGEAEVTITNHPLTPAPGYSAVVAKSKTVTYNDHNYNWEFSDKTSFYSPFKYQGS